MKLVYEEEKCVCGHERELHPMVGGIRKCLGIGYENCDCKEFKVRR